MRVLLTARRERRIIGAMRMLEAVVAIALLGAVIQVHAARTFRSNHCAGGDSPYYLLMARSLVEDGDLWISERELDRAHHLEDFPYSLDARFADPARRYFFHPIGAPVLFAPAYRLAGRRGVMVFVGLLATATLWLWWLYAAGVTGRPRAALAAVLATALAVPFLPLAVSETTEVPGLFFQAVALVAARPRARPGSAARWLLAGLALAVLPWIHPRYAAISAVLAVAGLARIRAPGLASAALLAPLVASFVARYAWAWHVTGALTATGPLQFPGTWGFSSLWKRGLPGSLFDMQGGLLLHAPHFALAMAGCVALARRGGEPRREIACHAAYLVPSLVAVMGYYNWSGHWGVACRYLAVALPALVLGLAHALPRRAELGVRHALLAVPFGVSLAFTGSYLVWPPLMLPMEGHEVNLDASLVELYRRTGLDVSWAFPRLVYAATRRAGLQALALALLYVAWMRMASRSIVVPLVLTALYAAAASATRPPGHPLYEDYRWRTMNVRYTFDYPREYLKLAREMRDRGRPDVARRAYARVLEVDPEDPHAAAELSALDPLPAGR